MLNDKPMIALLGRANVGKSTLFNRLVGKRMAITDDQPGVTRDWRFGEGALADLEFNLCDTAGLELPSDYQDQEASLRDLVKLTGEHSFKAAHLADILLFMIDGRAGVQPRDHEIANELRALNKPIILIANKCEGRGQQATILESYELGLGEPIALSAEHGENMGDLYDSLRPFIDGFSVEKEGGKEDEAGIGDEADEEKPDSPLRLAIVGRPNVGKSTLMNFLLNDQRVLTGPMAGLTRDAIYADTHLNGRYVRLVDTAGLRKKARVQDRLEKAAGASSYQAIDLAEMVLLLVAAPEGLEKQDYAIAGRVIEEGRGLIILINKMDLIPRKDQAAFIEEMQYRLRKSLPQISGVPLIPVVALSGYNIKKLVNVLFEHYELWQTRLPTNRLNHWLERIITHHPPPLISGRRIKPRYLSQVKSRPPSFALFGSRLKQLPEAWQRYLINRMREDFNLPGIPIRLILRETKNPYHKKDD